MISRKLMAFIGRREGFVSVAYPDGKHYSIGFGHNGPDVLQGDKITLEEGLRLFAADLDKFERRLDRMLRIYLKPYEKDAVLSAAYNLGNSGISPVVNLLNAGDVGGALRKWGDLCKVRVPKDDDPETPEYVVSAGLKKRREAEIKLFTTGDYGDVSKVPFWDGDPFKTKMSWIPFPEGQ